MRRLTIALAGDPAQPHPGLEFPRDFDLSYSDRPQIELEVQDDELVGDVLLRAADQFGVEKPEWGGVLDIITWIAFDDPARSRLKVQSELALLDPDGRVRWTHYWKAEPVREIQRAGAAGLINGDPERWVLCVQPGIGNGLLADFPTLLELWDLLWNTGAEELLKAYALAELARAAIRRARRAPETVRSKYEEWRRNGGRPDNLREFLGDHAWDLNHLATVLGCTAEQAEALLLGFGHLRGDDGLWRPGEDPESKFLQFTVELIINAPAVEREYLLSIMEERLRELSSTGEARELDWTRIGAAPHDPEINQRIIDSKQADFQERSESE